MRNPSKNTIKKILRPFRSGVGYGMFKGNYFLHNTGGARVYIISKGKICNIGMLGYKKYLTKANVEYLKTHY